MQRILRIGIVVAVALMAPLKDGQGVLAQGKVQVRKPQSATRPDTTTVAEPAVSDTTQSARIFLEKIEVFGTVPKPQALFVLPGSDPTVIGMQIDRSFIREIFRPLQLEPLHAVRRSRERLTW